jgi:predicted O-methyltransferase YrrM
LGISVAYGAAALELNGAGSLVTLEGSEARSAHATRNFRRLRLDSARVVPGLFQDTLGPVLEQSGGVDYAFIDGHHREDATLSYFDQIAEHASSGAVVARDDVAWCEGMKRAWESVRTRDVVAASIDLFLMGICVIGRSANTPDRFGVSIG